MPLRKDLRKVLVIGSGPIVIGQAAEFDYAGTQACLAFKEENIQVVLINNNPATIMTDQTMADRVYIEPLTVASASQVIARERPDGIIGTLGGQTGLNLTVQLAESGILTEYGVEILGTPVESIRRGEDREKFRQLMLDIKQPIPESRIVTSIDEGIEFCQTIGYPVILRPAYTLGGYGGGFAHSDEELRELLSKALKASPIGQVLVERSIYGWKEIEYEVMRDANDTCIIVCNMENMDAVGVHTGDSIVVAPSQTLTDRQHQMLRDAAIKIIRALEIVGGCNIQFALDPGSDQYFVIEVNPRVSRSSALASKATGYPIARMAAKCAVGYHLDELRNPITGSTFASFEPAIDYIVVKIPRFPFDKFTEADRSLGTQMKATGEVMAIDRSFEGALNKGLRSLEVKTYSLTWPALSEVDDSTLISYLENATDLRLFAIAEACRRGFNLNRLNELTRIDCWFLAKIALIVKLETSLGQHNLATVPSELLAQAKRANISDRYICQALGCSPQALWEKWRELKLKPGYKLVDTCAAEFEAITPYYYSTWLGEDEVPPSVGQKILVIGSGPIRIGQGIEFDYCSVQAALALKKAGYTAVVINNNPETVSTDYSIADRLYFEPLAAEDIIYAAEKEQVSGVLIQFGGQTAVNVAKELADAGLKVLGTNIPAIDLTEDRDQFYQLLNRLDIPHIAGTTVFSETELMEAAGNLGYPVLVRPSYVIGGQSMFIFYRQEELGRHLAANAANGGIPWPLLVDKYVPGQEYEIDVVSDGHEVIIPGIFQHIERAGVHSGDSVSLFPAQSLSAQTEQVLLDYARRIARSLPVIGIMNIQFVISESDVFVLEVNPRASRTVPIVSKVTQTPMVEWATLCQLGHKLTDLTDRLGLLPPPQFCAVKAPIFSNLKLRHVDSVLGPEMKSTGEVLGLGYTLEEALSKALLLGEDSPFFPSSEEKLILWSVADREKQASLPLIRKMVGRGLPIIATEGTATFLKHNQVPCHSLPRDKESALQLFRSGKVAALVNVPSQGRIKDRYGFFLRELAVRYQVPSFTCLDTVRAVLSLPRQISYRIQPINEYPKSLVRD